MNAVTHWILLAFLALAAVNVTLVAIGAVQVLADRRRENRGRRL